MQSTMIECGYERIMGPEPHPEAVTWWFFRSWDDGFAFARGGRCATSRIARRQLDSLSDQSEYEHLQWIGRPTHELMKDGTLRPLADVT